LQIETYFASKCKSNLKFDIFVSSVLGKALAKVFYGPAPRYSHFVGRSTAGPPAVPIHGRPSKRKIPG
jgi:hypothetical protein